MDRTKRHTKHRTKAELLREAAAVAADAGHVRLANDLHLLRIELLQPKGVAA